MLQRLSVSQHFSLLERRETEAILEAAFKDMAWYCLEFFTCWCAFLTDLCLSSIYGCKGAPAATSLWLARSLPRISLCSPSKEQVFHKWASPPFARGGWAYRQQEHCTAKTQWVLQTTPKFISHDAGVATGFLCGKERKWDSSMLCISEVLRMKMIKWNKTKRHIRPSLTALFHL